MNIAPPLAPLAALRWSIVRSVFDELQPRRTLEIGCGQGGFGARIAATTDYIGVEQDERSCATARSRITPPGGRVVQGTIDLIDAAERFDVVCAFEVLEHIEDDRSAILAWAGRVAPGGAIVVSVPAWPERYGAWDSRVGHYRRYRPEELDDILIGAGCRSVRHVLYGWPLGFATETVRNRIALRRQLDDDSMETRTAGSGRALQPGGPALGLALRVATAPFVELQKLRPTAGIGLVGVGLMGTPG